MYNYKKTAKVATALGVSPTIADGIIACTQSLPFVPDDVKKRAVNTILSTGLSSLRILRGDSFSSVDPRVATLQRYVEEGRTLPLIYPQHDIAYSYNILAESVENPPAMKFNVYTGACFEVGSRVPHVWLQVCDSHYVVSSIALGDALQSFCIVVPETNERKWRDALSYVDDKDIAFVVTKSSAELQSHCALQALHQWPNYESSDPRLPSLECIRDVDSVRVALQEHKGLVDITGRWQQLLTNKVRENAVVVIRPDGHIVYIGDNTDDLKRLVFFESP